METSKKDRLLVSLNALIDSNDIYGILIEKTAYNGNEQYTITLHFRPESYDKIREVTGQLIKKRLAIVRGSTILTASVVLEALTSYATIPTDFDFLDKFKEGLVPIDQASIETWNKRTIEWLEEKIKKNSDDTEMLVWLAREYNKNNPKDCEKTISLFEKNILANPALIMYARAAHGCYRFLKQYERALNFYKMTLSIIKDKIDEVDIRTMIMEIYDKGGTHATKLPVGRCFASLASAYAQKECLFHLYIWAAANSLSGMYFELCLDERSSCSKLRKVLKKLEPIFSGVVSLSRGPQFTPSRVWGLMVRTRQGKLWSGYVKLV